MKDLLNLWEPRQCKWPSTIKYTVTPIPYPLAIHMGVDSKVIKNTFENKYGK